MSGDYSRIAFDPWLDDLGVLLQQGRPLTDRDWNDQALQLNRRVQAGTLDTIGQAVVPVETMEGFHIEAANGELTIGRGRMYVDGLLAENHGQAPAGGTLDWDPHLAENFGADPVNYTDQINYPDAPDLPSGGPHLVYLDVWQREVNRYIRPGLMDQALAVDTTTRLQTVWQVKLLPDVGDTVTCSTALDDFPGWLPDHAPSAGRLTVTTAPVPGQDDPCQIPPSAGYKGLENQLYRVEIHAGGAAGAATFKWSRDNASVEASVVEIPSLTQIVVDSVGRDSVLRFSNGDWIEITDDWLELHNEAGLLRRIASSGGVDDATRTITLEEALPSGQFPVDGQNLPDANRHTRIRRWDQKHQILDATGTEVQDLDDAGADGTITVPADPATQILLEHNIVVSFSLQPDDGQFRVGDYWVFAARTADATVEPLTEAPPRAIHHHYAKLALVTFPDDETDCRQFWPPPLSAPPPAAEACGCTLCVTPESHSSGTLTIQMAIDQVVQRGGGTICLDVGTYPLQQALEIQSARSLHIVGQGAATLLESAARAVHIAGSQDVTLESFSILCRPSAQITDAAVALQGSTDVEVDRLRIEIENNSPSWAALGLAGALAAISIHDTAFVGATGIRSGDPTGGQVALADLRIDNNAFDCTVRGIQLRGVTVHQQVSQLRANRVTGCSEAGIVLTGATASGYGVDVHGNALSVQGHGIVASLDGLRVIDNEILLQADVKANHQIGVRLQPGETKGDRLDNVQIAGNHIAGFRGDAIAVHATRTRALRIARNTIERCGQGVRFVNPEALTATVIAENRLSQIDGFGLHARGASASLTATDNHISTHSAQAAASLVFERGEIIFDQNHVVRQGGTGKDADVVLGAATLIVGSNRIQTSTLSMELQVTDHHFTVVGNICRGVIQINGNPLQQPWLALNPQNVT